MKETRHELSDASLDYLIELWARSRGERVISVEKKRRTNDTES